MINTKDQISKPYSRAIRFARKLDKEHYRDLVHDAYLLWFDKKKQSIFEAHEGQMIQTIKNIWGARLIKGRFMWRGEINNKVFLDYNGVYEGMSNPNLIVESKYLQYERTNPHSILEGKDFEAKLLQSLSRQEMFVYGLCKEGYTPIEIAEVLNVYRQRVPHWINNIRYKFCTLNT